MADMDDPAREREAVGAMVLLEKGDLLSDFVDVDVVALAGIRLSEGVHGGRTKEDW